MHRTNGLRRIVAIAAFVVGCSPMAMAADGGIWSVSKSSGDVWVTAGGAEQGSPISQVSLGSDNNLKPGDTIRTGHNGRVLLVRGEETIVVAPNSVVGLPTESKDGMATTILQRAGSILLDVQKRNVKHFEVETPYLAAVVKGTHFSVTINADHTKVEVERGQVEVSDFKSGQIAQILPGQSAMAFDHGKPGLSLSGTGSFSPIEQGKSRQSSITRVPVPRNGITAPRDAKGAAVHAMKPVDATPAKNAAASGQSHGVPGTPAPIQSAQQGNRPLAQPIVHQGLQHNGRPVIRIATSIGEVRLNVQQATHGLAHGSVAAGGRSSRGKDTGSVWSSNGSASSGSASGSASPGNATASAVAAAIGSANASATWSTNGATGNGTKGTTTTTTTTASATASSGSGSSGSGTTTTGDGGTTTTGNSGGSTGGGGNSGSGNGNSGSGGGNSGNGGNGHHYGWWNNWWNSWQGHGRGG